VPMKKGEQGGEGRESGEGENKGRE